MGEAAIDIREMDTAWEEKRTEPKPDLVPADAPQFIYRGEVRDQASLGAVFVTWTNLSASPNIHELARQEPSTIVARLLAEDLAEDVVVPALETLAQVLAGRPSGGVAFLLERLRRRSQSETFRRAIATAQRHVLMPTTAQQLERFLSTAQQLELMPTTAQQLERFPPKPRRVHTSPTEQAMERLRELEREVDAAYDAIAALNSAASPIDEADMARAVEALEDVLQREAAAAREVLESRMSSLERTTKSARQADELIARYESDDS